MNDYYSYLNKQKRRGVALMFVSLWQITRQNFLLFKDAETGGFTDRPGDMVDLYHTLFGLAGLSLLGESSLKKINPVFCMPQFVLDKIQVSVQLLST